MSCFDPVLRERHMALTKISLCTIHLILKMVLILETSTPTEYNQKLDQLRIMPHTNGRQTIFSKMKDFVRRARGWGSLGAVKVWHEIP
jgi:hypothetical protein